MQTERDNAHWTKNDFNSGFPTSLACYMLDHEIPVIRDQLGNNNGKLRAVSTEINLVCVFNYAYPKSEALRFCFESRFKPYSEFSIKWTI
ncbi:MAG: HindVP family restriction endonuclease [Deltaproteobacteria bacterium]|nr:HindVP family restriction endonuclease [Deltaproteobacteria bacterium]